MNDVPSVISVRCGEKKKKKQAQAFKAWIKSAFDFGALLIFWHFPYAYYGYKHIKPDKHRAEINKILGKHKRKLTIVIKYIRKYIAIRIR